MRAAGVSCIAVCTSPVFSCPEKVHLQAWGCDIRQLLCVTHCSSFYVFHLSFLFLFPMPSVTLLSCLCPPIPPFSVPPAAFLPTSIPLSLATSHVPPVWPLCVTGGHKDPFLCAPCSALWFPLSSRFPLCFSLPCFVSLAVPLDFSLCLSVCLSACLCLSVFLHLSFSFCLFLLCLSQAHMFHIKALTLHSFKLELLNLSVLLPRQKCMPRCCVPERSAKTAHAGTWVRLPRCTQVKCIANKQWASSLPKGLSRAFWFIYDQSDEWGDSQKHELYPKYGKMPQICPSWFPCRKVGNCMYSSLKFLTIHFCSCSNRIGCSVQQSLAKVHWL